METFLIKALQLIAALALLVTIHEFGHYIFARIFGMKVNRYYLFFNPWFSLLKWYPDKGKLEIIAWTKKTPDPAGSDNVTEEPKALISLKVGKPHNPIGKNGRPTWRATMYGLGWLPLGGYCDIDGMVDETKSASDLAAEPHPWEFRTKPAWQRFMVMIAGVLFNFLLAIVIYAGIAYHWGDRIVPFDQAYEGMDFASPLHDAGFRDGDILLSLNGQKTDAKDNTLQWELVQPGARVTLLRDHRDTIDITVPKTMLDSVVSLKSAVMGYRVPVFVDKTQPGMPAEEAGLLPGDRIVKINSDTTPSMSEFYAALDANKGKPVQVGVLRDSKLTTIPLTLTENGKIGIQLRPAADIFNVEEVKYSLLHSLPRGWEIGTTQLVTYISSLKLIFSKEGAQQVGGFGAIGSMFPDTWNWYSFWQITAFLSVILAFMNIIPIPALDGGYLLFLIWEIITRRKPSDKFLEVANTVGFSFLLLLLIYANGNDIIRFFF